MRFCVNCGKEIDENAKFCTNCGNHTDASEDKRTSAYEGRIHKCPNCGEILRSFSANCPACGYEIRGVRNVSSVGELSAKLEAVEAKREDVAKINFIKNLSLRDGLTKTDERKVNLIRNFPIPNTKEDLYEFLVLSKSNVDVALYEDDNQVRRGGARLALSDAWKTKFEQSYQKAKIVFVNDTRMTEIQAMYDSLHKSIRKAKMKDWKIGGIAMGVMCAIIAIILISAFSIAAPRAEKKEVARLEAVVGEIEVALEAEEYKLALMNADSLDYDDGWDTNDEQKRRWKIQREYWIDKVIEEAAQNGVILDRPTDKESDKDEVEDIRDQSTDSEPSE